MATRMKEKTAAVKARREQRPFATAKHVRISPDKVRIVLALIRGKSVAEAMAILQATPCSAISTSSTFSRSPTGLPTTPTILRVPISRA